jgi:RNA polymerase sigma-70 factor (ECF subfamily)
MGRSGSSSFADPPILSVTAAQPRGYHPVEMTDAMLARSAKNGDAAAFALLVDRHARVCLRYATRMLGSLEDAEEAAQDAFWRAHRAIDRYDEQLSFRTWLMSILINRCRTSLLHRRRRTARIVVDHVAVDRASIESDAGDTELRDAIERALVRLDAGQREAFLLKHVELLSYDEMSAATGIGVSALKMRVQRACERLQDLLEEDRHG